MEVDVADVGAGVVMEHGIDGFGELRATGLVDAACVGPGPVEAVLLSLEKEMAYLSR